MALRVIFTISWDFVSVVEDQFPMEIQWMEKHLGLKMEASHSVLNSFLDLEKRGYNFEKVVGGGLPVVLQKEKENTDGFQKIGVGVASLGSSVQDDKIGGVGNRDEEAVKHDEEAGKRQSMRDNLKIRKASREKYGK